MSGRCRRVHGAQEAEDVSEEAPTRVQTIEVPVRENRISPT